MMTPMSSEEFKERVKSFYTNCFFIKTLKKLNFKINLCVLVFCCRFFYLVRIIFMYLHNMFMCSLCRGIHVELELVIGWVLFVGNLVS